MKRSDQPFALVGFLFGFSIAFWANSIATYYENGPAATAPPSEWIAWILTLIAGLVFLADIVCIMWWYMMYIYKIQTTSTLLTYALDFGVCAMFNTAGHKWTEPKVFFSAVVIASALLWWRFYNLYHSHEANDTDRRILKAAGHVLLVAFGSGAFALVAVFFGFQNLIQNNLEVVFQNYLTTEFLHPVAVIFVSGIGIGLTYRYRDKIKVSADIHEASTRPFTPMDMHWPPSFGDAMMQVTRETRLGLDEFGKLFKGRAGELDHDRLCSRVHSEGDLRVQSYILAIPSWTPDDEQSRIQQDEIKKKAFMVGASHWLDDLVDGRDELEIFDRLKKEEMFGLNLEDAEEIFERIYKDIIVNHTSKTVYGDLCRQIKSCALLSDNQKYLFFSLNRVAAGAVMFGPKIKEDDREEIRKKHNEKLVEIIEKEGDKANEPVWYGDVKTLIQRDIRADPSELGSVLLGFTTKTVQEMSMASERLELCFARSVLYSVLYAPLLYFHDIVEELACDEMVLQEAFEVNYVSILPWLEDIKKLLVRGDAPADPRQPSRLAQFSMAYRCFSPNLPRHVRMTLKEIYDPSPCKPHVAVASS